MKRTMIISVILFFLFIAPARMISATNNLQVRAQAAAPVVSLAQEEAAGSELQRHDLGHGRYVAIIPALAPEDTYNQQPYIDTYVYSIAPGTSYCTSTKLAVQYNTGEFGTEYQRAFIGFHLSSIPSEAIIDSATFYAYLYDAWGANPVNIELRRVTANWGCPLYWPGPKSVAAASRSVGLTAGWYTWDVTALVANYWKGKNFGQDPNYGFELRGPETGGAKYYHYRYFRSKNASNGRPFLVVQYHLPATDTPTPTRTPTATPTTTPTATPTPTATAYCPDPYEPNETFAAASLAGAGTYQAYICTPGDQDWFRIDLAPLQELRVILTDLPKNYSLELFDPFGVLVAGSHRDGMTSEEIRFTASAQGGAYRVRVRGVAGAFDPGSPYTLKFLPRPAPPAPTSTPTPTYTPIPSCGPDPYEPNDSSATAASITTGMEIHAYICPAMDSDYYRFSVSGPVEIHARLYDLPAAYELTLYDPSGWVVARGSGSGTSPRELTYLPTTTGDYLLRVGPGSPESWDEDHPYSLRVDLNDLPPITLFPVADTYVVEADPTSTHGDERQVIVGRDEFGQEQWGLFRFDLSDVPAVTIANATFMVSLYDVASGM
ncbi:MAG TPA: DNRLRE domain-containing protein, partial [Caldilineae bacterium]|nr:DNRLRE domain-containing protein [Caldilineae bacterium]